MRMGRFSFTVSVHSGSCLPFLRVWCRRHLPNGQIVSAVGDKCIGTSGDDVVLAACDGASAWEAQGNGDGYFAGLVHAVLWCFCVAGRCEVN